MRAVNILKIWTLKAEGMMFRVFILLIGFGLAVSGGVSLIMYLNLLTTGMDFQEYFSFISTRIECYLLIVGMIFIAASVYTPKNQKH
ncbi:hypothetical protein [Rossellomorea sp. BNER]|uniref:hypothetical protein n=1 Tax=Rossellomorea sp. BNER TaxID=2962031 RepID=UPI003AF2DD06